MSYRVTLQGLVERTRNPVKRARYEAELVVPPFPKALHYLWAAYHRLRRRKGGGFGPAPIEWPDIDAFIRRTGLDLRPWEIEIIEGVDDLFLASFSQRPTD